MHSTAKTSNVLPANSLTRRDFGKAAAIGSMSLAGLFAGGEVAEAGYKVDQSIFDLFFNTGNWATYNTKSNYLLWSKAGSALDAAIKAIQPRGAYYRSAVQCAISGKASAVQCPDGECVALVRAVTAGWGSGSRYATGNWKPGINVLNPPAGRSVPAGTVIARFNSQGRYVGGHTAVFIGRRSAAAGGGFSVWHQNVQGRFVTWQSILPGGSGYADAGSYYVVELRS